MKKLIVLALLILPSCAFLKGAEVVAQDACHSGLLQSAAVQAEAFDRGLPLVEIVDKFCAMVDVAAVFDAKRASANGSSPRALAEALLRA